jgi:hypothetical protein
MPARLRVLLPLVASLGLVACGGSGSVIERLDRNSGLTYVTDPSSPIAFARTEARFSRSARDYVYLGPVEINERGTRQYYLWVGIASTIDRSFLEISRTTPDRLYLALEGGPVEFELTAWDELLPPLAGAAVYKPAVAPQVVLGARITADQLALLARETIPSVRVTIDEQPTTEYPLWDEDAVPWPAFAAYAGDRGNP